MQLSTLQTFLKTLHQDGYKGTHHQAHGICNAGNSDKKYGGKCKDMSVTVQGNKSKFNHSSGQQWPWDFLLQGNQTFHMSKQELHQPFI